MPSITYNPLYSSLLPANIFSRGAYMSATLTDNPFYSTLQQAPSITDQAKLLL